MPRFCFLLLLLGAFAVPARALPPLLNAPSDPAGFPLVRDRAAAPLLTEPNLDPAVGRAAADFAADVARVSGFPPATLHELPPAARAVVIVGIIGRSPLLDQLARLGKFDPAALRGAWETFVIQTVEQPFPGVDQALVIAGSDRRGAIYGLYEISAAIGVSPWHWWADVPPPHRDSLVIAAGTHRFGPPSVRYRGIFLNDEDWGLQPWAARTFDPACGDIGPKTYAKVFELLLRLKANTLWPAMHACTAPFNADSANARLAADYAIVMGSSHAEPMLRNNVREWTTPHEQYNYVSNRDDVLRYWEERVAANAAYESIFTLGMRGIHDSHMVGPRTDTERIATLERIFADQRTLLARHLAPPVEHVPQIFCAYKEVLDLYRQGLRVPDDVTIVWPDDNFGYVRNFASPAERARSGGFGVYYHLSYLGRPLSYLWLSTTPPALIWEEMRKAYDHGADRLWIANVGDLKPAEIPTEFFLQLAWDIDRWRPDNLDGFLRDWAACQFGPDNAAAIAALLSEYYRLNFARRPEHLQWWLPKEPYRPSPLSPAEVQARLDSFARLRRDAAALRSLIPPEQQDAFFQLVYYPAIGSALANERYFAGERGDLAAATDANARLKAETRFFNEELSGGKWHGFMNLEPADAQWSSMRIAPWAPPPPEAEPRPFSARTTALPPADANPLASILGDGGARWTEIPGLGRSGRAVTVLPFTAPERTLAEAAAAPRLDYTLDLPSPGPFTLRLHLLPTHPISGTALRLAVALDEQTPRLVELPAADGGTVWNQAVLDNERIATVAFSAAAPGPHVLHLWGLDDGIVIDRVQVEAATAPAR
ncbi:MAG TPA: glycosyl hydrolase 115 family protein [Opitutaceae bacterium]|nr:glycosyl hydrolase 115 family protein [Opitutaceae bacterium]